MLLKMNRNRERNTSYLSRYVTGHAELYKVSGQLDFFVSSIKPFDVLKAEKLKD